MIESFRLLAAVDELLAQSNREYSFPAGGQISIPTRAEAQVIDQMRSAGVSDRQLMDAFVNVCEFPACCDIMIFGIRVGVLAVRTSSPPLFRLALVPCLAAAARIDWRDRLRALAVLEDCASRLGLDFQSELLRSTNDLLDDDELMGSIAAYLGRTDDMRRLDVMGIHAVDHGGQTIYLG